MHVTHRHRAVSATPAVARPAVAVAPGGAPASAGLPGVAFGVPDWLRAALDGAARAGATAAMSAPLGDAAFAAWSVANFPAGPPASSDATELAWLRRLRDARTPSQDATAVWYADEGDTAMWDGLLAQWQQTVGPREAAWGAELLAEARRINKPINDDAKARFGRTRPYVTDPSLAPVVSVSTASSPSYPSGHVAHAYLEATILAALVPRRADEFFAFARQMAMARMYGGVHYPTDTVGGAWEGALVATWLLRTHPRPTD